MLRFAQIGVGARGKTWARLLRDNPQTEAVAYIDSRLADLRAWAAGFGGGVPCFAGLEEALAQTRPDALLVATPPARRYEQIMPALRAGLPVLAEKPLADDLATAAELVREAEARAVPLMIGMNFRFAPCHQALRGLLAAKRLGEPNYAVFNYLRYRNGRRADLNQYALTARQPMLLEQSIHHFDLMRYCYGREVETVAADSWNPPWSMYQEDANAAALLRFAGGLRAAYVGTYTAGWNRFSFHWRTDCEGGVLIQKDQFGPLCLAEFDPELAQAGANFKREAEPLLPVEAEAVEPFAGDTRRVLESFVAAVQRGAPVESGGRDHLRTLALVFACIEAAATGQWVEMAQFYGRQGLPL